MEENTDASFSFSLNKKRRKICVYACLFVCSCLAHLLNVIRAQIVVLFYQQLLLVCRPFCRSDVSFMMVLPVQITESLLRG